MSIDPITLEIMSNGLKSIMDETYIALMKSAYSTNIKERHDHSTAIVDPSSTLTSTADLSVRASNDIRLQNWVGGVSVGDDVFGRGQNTHAEYAVLDSWARKPP